MGPAVSRPTEQAYAELQQAYDHFNERLFDSRLPGALITLQREKDTFGYFSRKRWVGRRVDERVDEIALNPSYFAVVPLVEVLQTLVHEMAHQWQHHFGNPGRGRYHNHEWAAKMEEIGLMPSDTGRPGGRRVGQKMADYAVDGGLFLESCEELITQSFTISWLDRFPTIKQLSMAQHLHSQEISEEAGGGRSPLNELIRDAVEADGGQGPIVRPTVAKVQTRNRYLCPCNIKVWGRPGLKILCGSCGGEFAESNHE